MSGFIKVAEAFVGSTIRTTWVSSGVTPSAIYSRLMDKGETLVNSFAGVSSGNGHYYGIHTLPGSAQLVVSEWHATIDGYPYIERQLIRVRALEAD